jgi:ubiquinone/menaquinone biosynthesis C-methylase UbiE
MNEQVSYRQYSGTAAENYERFFVPAIARPVADDLVSAARLRSGEQVLDVACGTGIIARLAAEKVGPDGSVVGVDGAPDMIEVARSAALPVGIEVDWRQGDAASLPLPDGSFDVVLCQMALMLFQDLVSQAPASAQSELEEDVVGAWEEIAAETGRAFDQPMVVATGTA